MEDNLNDALNEFNSNQLNNKFPKFYEGFVEYDNFKNNPLNDNAVLLMIYYFKFLLFSYLFRVLYPYMKGATRFYWQNIERINIFKISTSIGKFFISFTKKTSQLEVFFMLIFLSIFFF